MKPILFLILLPLLSLSVFALTPDDLTYPIEELGNCDSPASCEVYCSETEHLESCLLYAEANQLMTQKEIDEAKKILPFLMLGTTPGGCRSEQDCNTYCEQEDHLEECITFAEEAGFISHDEAELVKKTGGKGPGGCKGEEECMEYCSEDSHFDECITFLEGKDIISEKDLDRIKQIGSFKGPGGCMGEDECTALCENDFSTCIDFALQHGLISEKEAEMAKKTGGKGPGGCRGEDECTEYCNNPENQDECTDFAYRYGFMSEEEYKRAKMGGPGGCKGEEECTDYCNNPDNQLICMQFAYENGFMSEEEYKRATAPGPGGCLGQECQVYCEQNPMDCGEFYGGMPPVSPPVPIDAITSEQPYREGSFCEQQSDACNGEYPVQPSEHPSTGEGFDGQEGVPIEVPVPDEPPTEPPSDSDAPPTSEGSSDEGSSGGSESPPPSE